jgi:hypothetical protein
MFDRFKKSASGTDKRPDVQSDDARPAPGGFGRRQTPVGGSPAEAPAAAAPSGFGRRPAPVAPSAAAPSGDAQQPPSNDAQQPPSNTGPTDLTRPIFDWLTAEIGDGSGGIHCETAMIVLGALAGFAAQQAVWARMAATGTPQQAVFTTVRVKSGETFYLSDQVNDLVAARIEPPSILGIVAGAAAKAGGRDFPDIKGIFSNAAETMGSELFGRPRAPADHAPRILPRDALTRYWHKAHSFVEREHPAMKFRWFAVAAGMLLLKMQESCPPDIAFSLMMEAAVPMSKIDPKTVPTSATH